MSEVEGRIKFIGETQVFASGFQKRLVVIAFQDGQFENIYPVEFQKDKVDYLNKYQVGQTVKVRFNIRGSEWDGKYFTNLIGWMIKKNESGGDGQPPMGEPQVQSQVPAPQVPTVTSQGEWEDEDDENIPF